ncbi:DUF3047 domain-containing protein [Variovorax sp. J22P168]|uniref:DUF3047 domain-containing protein n=1 Tax=Variovorax jilinensis TaxID=3053513 RepID=UPI0025785C5C|nr:DUF3047 domain-containing protein [Variovorax sp. J22P168]MDM0012275.1 DUF3047 domain-containing protein [Variovorax sp. J22P168]
MNARTHRLAGSRGWFARSTGLALSALLWAAAPAAHAEEAPALVPFSSASSGQAPAPWRFTTLPNKTATSFEVVALDGQRVLKVEADRSYGNLVHPTRTPLNAATTLAWRWRVDEFVENADLRTRSGDDGAAKVCVFFDFPTDKLPVSERTRLALARSATGEQVPSEALCYVWDGKEPKGSALINAFTKRVRMVVLESGPATRPGTWMAERRNLLADYKRAFGDEAGDAMPDVVAVAISADADNTQGHGIAYFSDVMLLGGPNAQQAATTVPPAKGQ